MASLCPCSPVHTDYNVGAVQALMAVGHCVRCFADGDRQGFAVHKDLDMRVAVVELERVHEGQDENAVMMDLSSLESYLTEVLQEESTVAA